VSFYCTVLRSQTSNMSKRPDPPSVSDHFALAKQKLTPSASSYFFGGSGAELCMTENIAAFQRVRLRPRVLRPISRVDTAIYLHAELPQICVPIMIAPMALQSLAHPDGEVAVSRAAASLGIPMVLSMNTSKPVEHVLPYMQQIYVLRDRQLTISIVERAKSCGVKALVMTVDAPRLGRRFGSEKHSFALPQGVGLDYLKDTLPKMDAAVSGKSALNTFMDTHYESNLCIDTLKWLINISGLPVWVKGVLHPEDARIALTAGAAGIMVSNHGGRQVDAAVASLDALEDIVAVARSVDTSIPVVLDSGIRCAEDVVKALALGATAIMIGRPVIAALAADGERGVKLFLRQFKSDLKLAMMLCGAANCAEIDTSLVARNVKARL